MYLFKCSCRSLNLFSYYRSGFPCSAPCIQAHLRTHSCLSASLAGNRQQTSLLSAQTALPDLTETITYLQFFQCTLYSFRNRGLEGKSPLFPPALKEKELYACVVEVEFEFSLLCVVCHQNKGTNSNGTFVY